ncbi:hypothetical protein [Rhodococcus rhodochrous]|uniref:hypothetical protein n=1 Tax=Rhodococcus rhodochrous TaxID=1829 RepID=UPI0023F6CDC2
MADRGQSGSSSHGHALHRRNRDAQLDTVRDRDGPVTPLPELHLSGRVQRIVRYQRRDTGAPLMAPPRKGPREGIVSRVVFFVVVIGIVFGIFQTVTGGTKVGDDGWFRIGNQKITELFDRGSDTAKEQLEEITDGAGTQLGETIREQLSTTAPASEGNGE